MNSPHHEGLAPRQPVTIVRLENLDEAVALSTALADAGVRAVEFTLTNHRALAAVEQVRESLGDSMLVGAGTVLDAESARAAILAGAQFLVTPVLRLDVIECGRRYGVPVMCGAFTPTEIQAAWEHGAEFVKVFPARSLGPAYIRDVLAPLPGMRLVPTGGVGLDNCAAYLDAGAYTVAAGSSILDEGAISRGDWAGVANLARRFVEACAVT